MQTRADAAILFALVDAQCDALLACDLRIAAASIRLSAAALSRVASAAHASASIVDVMSEPWPQSRVVAAAVDAVVRADEAALLRCDAQLVDAVLQYCAVCVTATPSVLDAHGGWRGVLAFAVNCFHIESLFVERAVCRLLARLAAVHVFPEPIWLLIVGDTHVCLQVLLEALHVADTVSPERRAALLALVTNRLLPNAFLSLSHADRLVQVAVLDCVALAAACAPPLVDVAALSARVAAFVASGDAHSAVLAFRVVTAINVRAADAAAVERVVALFESVLASAAPALDGLLRGDSALLPWHMALTAALKTAHALATRYGRGDSERLWTLLPAAVAFRRDAIGDASGGVSLAALTLLAALGKLPGRWSETPAAEASLVAALRVVAGGGVQRHATLALTLDAALDALQQQPAFVASDSAVLSQLTAELRALFASELWERRDTAVDAAVRLAVASRSAAAPLVPLVVSAVSDEQPYVRAVSLKGFVCMFGGAHVPPPEAVLRGVAAIGDSEAVVRRAACQWLEVLLTHGDAATQRAAVERLAQVRDAFDRLMFDADWEVKRALIGVLRVAVREHGAAFLGADCVARLMALLEDSARLVRLDAAAALLAVRAQCGGDANAALAALDLEALVAVNSEYEPWNTDFDGIEVSEQRRRQAERAADYEGFHSHHHGGGGEEGTRADDDGDAEIEGEDDDGDDDVPLDCE